MNDSNTQPTSSHPNDEVGSTTAHAARPIPPPNISTSYHVRHSTARSGHIVPWWLFSDILQQRESRNDLTWLSPQRADELFEAWLRGETAEIQLIWDRLEKFDSVLFACLRARTSAIGEMHWAIEPDATAIGNSPELASLADKQRTYLYSHLSAIDNLSDAIIELARADFHGVAALEIVPSSTSSHTRWEPIHPWLLCRPAITSPWMYNPAADPVPAAPELLDPAAVILREADPIDLPAMFLIIAKRHGVQAWDAFLDKFGIPAAFFETPPGATEEQAAAFDAIVQRLIGEGAGTIPSGSKLHTFETARDNTQTFEARARWCDEALMELALGGKLTMTTEAGSGTLAGNAHQQSFDRLCAATARSICQAINSQFCHPLLRSAFPGDTPLVRFTLNPEKTDDRAATASLIASLATAGFYPSAQTVSSLVGFDVTASTPTPTPPPSPPQLLQNIASVAPPILANHQEPSHTNATTPTTTTALSPTELDALSALAAAPPNTQRVTALASNFCNILQSSLNNSTSCSPSPSTSSPQKTPSKTSPAKT